MTRYFVVMTADDEIDRPFVIAESSAKTWVYDVATWRESVVLSEEEIALDPDFAAALAEWKAGDDRAYAAYEAMVAAESAIDDAEIELAWEAMGRPEPRPRRSMHDMLNESRSDLLEALAEIDVPQLRYAWLVEEMFYRLWAIECAVSQDEADEHARHIARELVNEVRRRGIQVV